MQPNKQENILNSEDGRLQLAVEIM